MGLDKQYDGYEPYEYLQAGEDYEPFEFPETIHSHDEPYEVPLSAEEETRAEQFSADNTIVSLHEHA
ncbi:MAG: peptidase M19, partial [Halobacteriales archaeon]|nr:peptidase M19 [Halobacteriales archaeon]